MKKMHLFIATFLLGSTLLAQHKDNKWFLDGTAGYAFSTAQKYEVTTDLNIVNDTVVSVEKDILRKDASSGLQIEINAMYLKKSGWFYNLGAQCFISNTEEYFGKGSSNMPDSWYYYSRHKYNAGYLMLKVGLGYKTNYKHNANLFFSTNLLYGGGWKKGLSGRGYEYYDFREYRSTYGSTFLLSMGINFELGTELKLTKRTSALIKGSFNAAFAGRRFINITEGYGPVNNPTQVWESKITYKDPLSGAAEFFNFVVSVGIRYQLTK